MSPTKGIDTVIVPEPTTEIVERFPVPINLRRSILVKPQTLMGTGPTNPTQRVTEALSKPVMGLYAPELHQVSLITSPKLLILSNKTNKKKTEMNLNDINIQSTMSTIGHMLHSCENELKFYKNKNSNNSYH